MQEYYIGPDLNTQLAALLQKLNVTKVFLVRGKKSYTSCGASDVMDAVLNGRGIKTVCFFDFLTNPRVEDVRKGVLLCKSQCPNIILAVGGGSALDMAKLIRYHIYKETDSYIPLVVIPTTAGTGAETTHFSVCYINGEKQSIADSAMLPDYAFVCSELTSHNDAYLTACTGFDAVAQAIESYWSVNSTDESRSYSLKALGLLWKQLPLLIKNLDNKELRSEVAEGAYYAGRAIDITTTTAPHAFSYKFTSLYGIPHGHAVALTFPYFFALNLYGERLQSTLDSYEYGQRMKLLVQFLDADRSDFLSCQLHMSTYISSLGLSAKALTLWAEDCSRDFENVLLKYGFYKKRAFYLVTVDSNGKRTRKLTEIALDYDGLQVDIFFSFRKTEITRSIFVYCPPVVNEKMTAREFVLPIGLSPRLVTVRNKQYPAFADPHKTLSLIYGEDFMIPRKNASATKSIQSNVIIHDMFVAYGEGFMLE